MKLASYINSRKKDQPDIETPCGRKGANTVSSQKKGQSERMEGEDGGDISLRNIQIEDVSVVKPNMSMVTP